MLDMAAPIIIGRVNYLDILRKRGMIGLNEYYDMIFEV